MTCTRCGAELLVGRASAYCTVVVRVRLSGVHVRLVGEELVLDGRCQACRALTQIRDPYRAMVQVSRAVVRER